MIIKSSPSTVTSVPDHLPNRILSPFFTSRAVTLPSSDLVPLPTATTFPSEGFSFAVSGIIIPPGDFSSSSNLLTNTRSVSYTHLTLPTKA